MFLVTVFINNGKIKHFGYLTKTQACIKREELLRNHDIWCVDIDEIRSSVKYVEVK